MDSACSHLSVASLKRKRRVENHHTSKIAKMTLAEPSATSVNCLDGTYASLKVSRTAGKVQEGNLFDAPLSANARNDSSRYSMPDLKTARDIFGASQKPLLKGTPIQRLMHRLRLSQTPIVDRLYGPARQFAWFARHEIVNELTRAICARKKSSLQGWHSSFYLKTDDTKNMIQTSKGRKSRKKRHCFTNPKLRTMLLSAFGHLPFDPQSVRILVETTLEPLIVANIDRFPELRDCGFLQKWDEVKIIPAAEDGRGGGASEGQAVGKRVTHEKMVA